MHLLGHTRGHELTAYGLTHMWFNLAAAQGNVMATSYRNAAAKLMTASEIAEAQRLAPDWKPKAE